MEDQPLKILDKKVEVAKNKSLRRSGDIQLRVYDLILNGGTGVEMEEISRQASFSGDFGWDDLDIIEFFMDVEVEFDIQIPDEAEETLQTVGNVIDYVAEHADGGSRTVTEVSEEFDDDSEVGIDIAGGEPRFKFIPGINVEYDNDTRIIERLSGAFVRVKEPILTYVYNGHNVVRTATVFGLQAYWSPWPPTYQTNVTYDYFVNYVKKVDNGTPTVSQGFQSKTSHIGPM
jgi:acyl carrier protein